MKNKLVSIITPTYNHEKYIAQCIKSVLSQTYPYWEQIIIDDGSTDDTRKIIAQFNDKRIKYIKQDNIGIYRLKDTYNKALNYSKGELIAILEGDDFWPSDKLQKQIKAFNDENIVLSWGKVATINENNDINKYWPEKPELYTKMSFSDTLRTLLFDNFLPACTVVCRKDALISIGGFKQPINCPYVDYPTWLNISLNGEFYPINEIMGYYRIHNKQISKTKILEMVTARNFSIDFYNKLPRDIKDLINIKIKNIKSCYNYKIALVYLYLVKIELRNHEWKKAYSYFLKGLGKILRSLKFKLS